MQYSSPTVKQLSTVHRVQKAEMKDLLRRLSAAAKEERNAAPAKWNSAHPLPKNPKKWEIVKRAVRAVKPWYESTYSSYSLEFVYMVWTGKKWQRSGTLYEQRGNEVFTTHHNAFTWVKRQKNILAQRTMAKSHTGSVRVKLPGGQTLTLKKGQYTLLS